MRRPRADVPLVLVIDDDADIRTAIQDLLVLTHLKCSALAYCFAVARTASVIAFMSPFFVSSRAAFA